jgi:hypothetical protein
MGIVHNRVVLRGDQAQAADWNEQHVQRDDHDCGSFQMKNIVIDNVAAFPASPLPGQIIYRTDLHRFYICNGTAWIRLVQDPVYDKIISILAIAYPEVGDWFSDGGGVSLGSYNYTFCISVHSGLIPAEYGCYAYCKDEIQYPFILRQNSPILMMRAAVRTDVLTGDLAEFGMLSGTVEPFHANQHGIYFKFKDGRVYAVCGNHTTETLVDVGAWADFVNDFHIYLIEVTNDSGVYSVNFFIDDLINPLATITTNITVATLNPIAQVSGAGSVTNRLYMESYSLNYPQA